MAATTATGSCKSTTFYRLSAPKPPPSYKFFPLAKQFVYSYRCSSSSLGITQPQSSLPWSLISTRSVSSPESAVVEEAEEESGATTSDDEMPLDSGSLPPLAGGCKACGREEIERGCNGEGRIQGGIATVPGFGWWPIKAYRPCPAYVASGGRYRRSGQSMDEVVSGRGIRDVALGGNNDRAQSSKKKEGSKKIKR